MSQRHVLPGARFASIKESEDFSNNSIQRIINLLFEARWSFFEFEK